MRIRSLGLYLVTLLWSPSFQVIATPIELVLFSTDSPPIWSASLPKNGLGGEILNTLAQEAGLDIKINYLPLKRYEMLYEGNRVGNPMYFIGQEFSAVIPLLVTEAGFCYYQPHHPDGKRLRNLTDLYGMTLGVIRGTVASKDEFASYGVKIEENTSLEALFNKLKQGRIDVALVINTTAYHYINRLFPNESANFQFNGLANGETPIAVMLDKNTPNVHAISAKLSQALQNIIADGRYYQILSGYQYSQATINTDWRNRIERLIEEYRPSPIIIHE